MNAFLRDAMDTQNWGAHSHWWIHMSAAVGAGFVTTTLTNPLWLIKVRLQTQQPPLVKGGASTYQGIVHAMQTILRQEGIRGFYKGLPASLLGLSHVAIQFPLYEWLKQVLHATDDQQRLKMSQIVIASSLSKVVAGIITYPHEVLRSRFQKGRHVQYESLLHSVETILKQEGPKAFMQGLGTSLIRVVPTCAITFSTYEFCIDLLNQHNPP